MTNADFIPRNGMDVFGSDGEKVGTIDAVEGNHFVVRKGWFFPDDHYIPLSAVNTWEEDAVFLNVTKEGALEQQWGVQPVDDFTDTTADSLDDTYLETTGEDPLIGTTDTAYGQTGVDDPTYGETAVDDTNRTSDETIEVREEDLQATTREVDKGSVHVDKHVVEEQQSLEVPLTEEEVHVERRAVDRPADGTDLQDTSVEVPLRGEEVEVSKTARVVEEIDIDKTDREHVETVSDTVRHEEVDIDTNDVHGGNNRERNDDRGLMDKAKDAMDGDNNGDAR